MPANHHAGARDPGNWTCPPSPFFHFASPKMSSLMSQNPPPTRRIATETQALNALSVTQTRFRRLVRLGLLSPAAGGGFEIDDLRRQYAAVEELERRVAAISGDGLTPAERNGAFAWLIEAARRVRSNSALPDQMLGILDRISAQLSPP